MKAGAETGGRRPSAQGRMPGAPRSRKMQEGPSLASLEGLWPCPHRDLSLPGSRTVTA